MQAQLWAMCACLVVRNVAASGPSRPEAWAFSLLSGLAVSWLGHFSRRFGAENLIINKTLNSLV